MTTAAEVPQTAVIGDGWSNTVEEVYQQLRSEILHGTLPADSILSQVKLAERLGVNRTPLREALRMLQRDNLVEAQHNRRVRISSLTSADLVQLYSLRIVQEGLAIRLTVPRLEAIEIARLRELIGRMSTVASAETLEQWEYYHREFHTLLISRAGSRITQSAGDLSDYCERYRRALLRIRPVNFTIGASEHEKIAECCEARDPEGAAVALARHLGTTALTLVSVTDPSFDPSEVRQALRQVEYGAQGRVGVAQG